jgi:hypothetical protein
MQNMQSGIELFGERNSVMHGFFAMFRGSAYNKNSFDIIHDISPFFIRLSASMIDNKS